MNKRLGFIGILVEDRKRTANALNEVLSDYGDDILARTGLPYKDKNCSVITLIVDMDTDTLGALTGKLGKLEGISVKSALLPDKK